MLLRLQTFNTYRFKKLGQHQLLFNVNETGLCCPVSTLELDTFRKQLATAQGKHKARTSQDHLDSSRKRNVYYSTSKIFSIKKSSEVRYFQLLCMFTCEQTIKPPSALIACSTVFTNRIFNSDTAFHTHKGRL